MSDITSKTDQSVLLVDDEPYIVEMLTTEMADRGIKFHTATNGTAALALIESEKPSVIVSDYKMPGLNGVELLRFLRNMDYTAPVIWITGNADDETRTEAWKLGVYHLFQKPFDPDEVANEIVRALEIGPKLWQELQPTFFTQRAMGKTHQKILLELEKSLYEKCKEHCLQNSISLNSFISQLIEKSVK